MTFPLKAVSPLGHKAVCPEELHWRDFSKSSGPAQDFGWRPEESSHYRGTDRTVL